MKALFQIIKSMTAAQVAVLVLGITSSTAGLAQFPAVRVSMSTVSAVLEAGQEVNVRRVLMDLQAGDRVLEVRVFGRSLQADAGVRLRVDHSSSATQVFAANGSKVAIFKLQLRNGIDYKKLSVLAMRRVQIDRIEALIENNVNVAPGPIRPPTAPPVIDPDIGRDHRNPEDLACTRGNNGLFYPTLFPSGRIVGSGLFAAGYHSIESCRMTLPRRGAVSVCVKWNNLLFYPTNTATLQIRGSGAPAAGSVNLESCQEMLPESRSQRYVCQKWENGLIYPTSLQNDQIVGSTSFSAGYREVRSCLQSLPIDRHNPRDNRGGWNDRDDRRGNDDHRDGNGGGFNEADRFERDRIERDRHERDRLERERNERDRFERERHERDRLERERNERDRFERERHERDRQERERNERDRSERERHERDRQERERNERDRSERERHERDRQEREPNNGGNGRGNEPNRPHRPNPPADDGTFKGEGLFHYQGTIYYSNGTRYCAIQSWSYFVAQTGRESSSGIPNVSAINTSKSDGVCNFAAGRLFMHAGTIYKQISVNQYCGFSTWESYVAITGKHDSEGIPNVDGTPVGSQSAGVCQ